MRLLLLLVLAGLALAAAWAHWPEARLAPGEKADRVVVDKAARRLSLYRGERLLKQYRVALGPQPVGHKRQEGDQRTPEGRYVLDWRNPRSDFHLSLHVSYPAPADIAAAKERGVPPGGDIMVHGLPNGRGWLGKWHRFTDWTAGCVAVTNPEIEEIWAAVPDGTPIEIHE